MAFAASPLIFVVSHLIQRADALRAALDQVEVKHIANAEHLLREAHVTVPAVVLLYDDMPGKPLSEIVPILREREELAGTYWLAVGEQHLGDLLMAGADALISRDTPVSALALQVGRLLQRAEQYLDLHHKRVTLQRRLESNQKEEEARDQLVHMLVHDLKNPIAAVRGLIELVRDDPRLAPENRDLLVTAHDETQHLLYLTLNMLDVRKMQSGKLTLNRELIFSPMFEEVIEQAQGDVGNGLQDRQLVVKVTPNLSPTSADPEILRRVLTNLISNAYKHTTQNQQIEVRVWQADNLTYISVRDSGEGIPAEDLPNLFAAFEQSRLTLHGRFDTGMGLAFCKLAVEEHGGHIWAESERGNGSTFTLTLPLTQDDDDLVDLLV